MNQEESKKIIGEVLARRASESPGSAVPPGLDESISRSVDFAPELKALQPRTLRAAMEMAPDGSGYVQFMQYIRELMNVQNRHLQENRQVSETQEPADPEAANTGFFLRCRKSWERYGHLGAVNDLTVSYTSEWITSRGGWLTERDLRWCDEAAAADASVYDDGTKREQARIRSRDEAIVSLVMMKLDRKAESDPAKVEKFLKEKKYLFENTKK